MKKINKITIKTAMVGLFLSSTCSISNAWAEAVQEEWIKQIVGPGDGHDHIYDSIVDKSGNYIITGSYVTSSGNSDLYVVKYDTDGNVLWQSNYDGPATGSDTGRAIKLDSSGNIYVTGLSFGGGNASNSDVITIKLSSSGQQLWAARYAGTDGSYDAGSSIVIDTQGDILVGGHTKSTTTDYDFLILKYDTNGNLKFQKSHNGPGNGSDNFSNILTDKDSNIYVTGRTKVSYYNDYITTIKYDSNGTKLWSDNYTGAANYHDDVRGMAIDSSGNIYIAGKRANSSDSNDADILTMKYDTNGNRLWTKYYNGPGNRLDYAVDIAIDSIGDVVVFGSSDHLYRNRDFVTIKYSKDGTPRWAKRYDGAQKSSDTALRLTIDNLDNIYVSGTSRETIPYYDVATIKYNTSGQLQWVSTYNGPTNDYDVARTVAVDQIGNTFVSGLTRNANLNWDIVSIKYAPSNKPPLANAGVDQTVECMVDASLATLDGRNSSDPDGDVLSFNWTGSFGSVIGATPTVVLDLGAHTIKLDVNDGNGGSASDTVVVDVVDTTAPSIDAGSDRIVEAESADGAPFSLIAIPGADCTPVSIGVSPTPLLYPIGSTIITATATDGKGNSASDSMTLTVKDTIPPVVSAPDDITEEATGTETTVDLGDATATDAVGVVSLSNDAPAAFPLGTTVVTWTAKDANPNEANDKQNVTIIDSTAPVVTAPGDVSAEATGETTAVKIGTASATDAVGVVSLSNDAPAEFPIGTTVVTWTATDGKGNAGTATQNVVVEDTTAPVVTAPADATAEATGTDTVVDIGSATATDAVGVTSLTSDAPAVFPVGTTVVTWTATDAEGNTGTAIQNVTVEDTTAPVVTAPANVSGIEATGTNTIVEIGTATATDAVGVKTLTSDAPASFPVGTTVVTWTATDAAGNAGTATHTVTVEDTIAPVVTAPAYITGVEATSKNTDVTIGAATATDAVGVETLGSDAPASFPVGTTVVTWTATDAAGNAGTATQNVTVQDTTPPTLTVSASKTVEATNVMSIVSLGSASALDLVDGIVPMSNDAPAAFGINSTNINWTASDNHGNSATATQVITVVDTTVPVLTVPTDVSAIATGIATSVNLGMATASDIFDVTLTNDAPATFAMGTTVVNWKATDDNGNVSTGKQNVTVSYQFNGYQAPLSEGGIYKAGRTLPVKINLSYANGTPVETATPTIAVYQTSNAEVIGEALDISSSSAADAGNVMRATNNGDYIYNLDTSSLSKGTYQIVVTPNQAGKSYSINIALK